MLRSVSMGFGGKLHLIDGSRVHNTNLTFTADPTTGDPQGAWKTDAGASAENWMQDLFGGTNTIMPGGGYNNHKPCAFYYGDLYTTLHLAAETPDVYITKFDGSGLFKHGGFTGTNGYNAAWRNGRGTELLSPSGVTAMEFQSCAHIVHNNVLFILGAASTTAFNELNWVNKDWAMDGSITNGADQADRRRRRRYGGFVIIQGPVGKTRKLAITPTEFANADGQEDTQACDAVSFGNDIYFASQCDLLRFPGGSGTPSLIEDTVNIPSPKSLEIYPSGGFNAEGNAVNDKVTGLPDVMVLSSSGVIKSIVFPSGLTPASGTGTRTVFNVSDLIADPLTDARSIRTGNSLQRVTSATLEPPRSCLLKNFNNKLNAFISTATSGYYHFQCNGDPSVLADWSNRTAALPDDIKRFDGDLYGFHDEFRDLLYIMHVSKSEYGLWGTMGGQKGAGGMVISELDKNNNWRIIYEGMSAEPPVGLIPYNNLGTYSQMPSGSNPQVIASTDYALLTYQLYSAYPRNVNVNIEYTINKGVSWNEASQFKSYSTGVLLGEGKENLSASFHGNTHTFYWNYVKDIGFNDLKEAKLRIISKVIR